MSNRHCRLAVAALLLSSTLACKGEGAQAEAPGEQAAPAANVEVVRARQGAARSTWRFLAQVEPALQARLATAVEGHVLEVGPREGDRVEKGDVLVALDSRKTRAALASARATVSGTEAELSLARRQHDRVKDLRLPTISEAERESFAITAESLEARLQAERAEVQRLQVEASQHSLHAPFDGVVKSRQVDPGAWVQAGEAVLELLSLQELEVHVDVSAEVGSRLEVGQRARLVGRADCEATIVGIVPALDPTTRTMRVRLSPIDPPPRLMAGAALEAEFEVELEGDGVLVPRDAVLRGAVQTRVMVVRDGRSLPITVEVVASSGADVLVQGEGLRTNDQVIVRGNERLTPGQPVDVGG